MQSQWQASRSHQAQDQFRPKEAELPDQQLHPRSNAAHLHPNDRQPDLNWWDGLSRNALLGLRREPATDNALASAHVQVRPVAKISGPPCRNDPGPLNGLDRHLVPEPAKLQADGPEQHARAATPSNWWVNPSVAMVREQEVAIAVADRRLQVVRACPAACASRWRPVSSCSCKNRVGALEHRRRAAPMAHR